MFAYLRTLDTDSMFQRTVSSAYKSVRPSIVRSPAPVKSRQENHLYSKQLQNCNAFIALSCRSSNYRGPSLLAYQIRYYPLQFFISK